MNRKQAYNRVDYFSELESADKEAIARRATTRSFRKNTILISAGDESDCLFVVMSGRLKVYLADERGKEISIRIAGPGEVVGELAVLSKGPRAADVICLEDCQLSVISRSDFMECMHDHPEIAYRIIQSLVERIRTMTDDISTLALPSWRGLHRPGMIAQQPVMDYRLPLFLYRLIQLETMSRR